MKKGILGIAILVLILVLVGAVGCTRSKPGGEEAAPPAGAGAEATPTLMTIEATPTIIEGMPTLTPTPAGPVADETPAPTAEAPVAEGGPTAVPAAPAATPAPGEGFEYTVRWGDTLASIATRFGTTVQAITELNNLTNPNQLYVGQKLRIPGTPPATAPTGETVTHVVQRGETLHTIAAQYGLTWQTVAAANNIVNPNLLYVGQKLIIPVGETASSETGVRTHVVQRGESLNSIALRYGTTVQAIVQANNLSNPNFIYPGQVLRIP